jgi:tetratricopeptide (TPR) repeat protein
MKAKFWRKTASIPGKIHSNPILASVVIFCISLLLRVAYYLKAKGDPLIDLPILDAKYYSEWAKHIIQVDNPINSAFFVEPGYAYILALTHRLFGSFDSPIIFLQVILGSLTCVLIFLIARKLWQDPLASAITAITVIIFQPFVFYDLLLLKTTFEIFTITVIIYFTVSTWEKQSVWFRFVLGVLIGIASLIKANVFYSLPFLIIALTIPKPRLPKSIAKNALMLCFGTFLAIAPATIHNWQKSHSIVPINYSGGPNLYIGIWEQADGSLKPPEFISVDPTSEEKSWQKATQAYLHHEPSSGEISSFWTKEAIKEAITNPVRAISLTFKKTILLISATTIDDNYDIAYGKRIFPFLRILVPFWIVAIFGILGIFASFSSTRNKKLFPLYALTLSYTLTLIASHIAERYRLALFPIFAVFAGYFTIWFKEKLEKQDYASITKYVTALMILIFFAWIPFPSITHTTIKDMHNNFGAQYELSGNIDQAKEQYELSLKQEKKYVPAMRNLARIALREGNIDGAIEKYRAALQIQYDLSTDELKIALDAKEKNSSKEELAVLLEDSKQKDLQSTPFDVDYIEGMRFFRNRQFDQAAEKFEKAYRRNGSSEAIMTNLATSYKNSKQPEKAQQFFEKALELNDYNLPAHYNLGNLFSAKKSYPKAIAQYERINEIVPGFQLSRYYLAQSYAENKDMQKSIDAYRLFIEESQNNPAFRQQVEEAKKIVEKATLKIFK